MRYVVLAFSTALILALYTARPAAASGDDEVSKLKARIEKLEAEIKALKQQVDKLTEGPANQKKPPVEDLVLDGKEFHDVSAAPGTHIKKRGAGVAIVSIRDVGNYTLTMDGPGTLYLLGTDDYSTVEVISKTGDGDLVWVMPNPKGAAIGPRVKGKIEGKGKIRMGTQKEVNDLRSKL
jgi:hypothetical protein